MKIKGLRIASVKRTVLGRTFCRLLGDEMGAVAMEYVVIALLIVAAAVGAAVYFSKGIAGGLEASISTITDSGDGRTVENRTLDASQKLRNIKAEGEATTRAVQTNIHGAGMAAE